MFAKLSVKIKILLLLGVALAFSVHLINASALSEFASAVRAVNGQPDIELRAAQGGFDDALLERVWDDATESLDRTVDAHVKTLRAKMKQIAPQLEPIRTHRGSGYALAEDLPTQLSP